jgi:hypothetical protein
MWKQGKCNTVFSKPFHAIKDEIAEKRLHDLYERRLFYQSQFLAIVIFGTAVKPLREFTAQVNAPSL